MTTSPPNAGKRNTCVKQRPLKGKKKVPLRPACGCQGSWGKSAPKAKAAIRKRLAGTFFISVSFRFFIFVFLQCFHFSFVLFFHHCSFVKIVFLFSLLRFSSVCNVCSAEHRRDTTRAPAAAQQQQEDTEPEHNPDTEGKSRACVDRAILAHTDVFEGNRAEKDGWKAK